MIRLSEPNDGAVRMPERFVKREGFIYTMKAGDTAYVVPWAVFVLPGSERTYLMGRHTISPVPKDEMIMRIMRTGDGSYMLFVPEDFEGWEPSDPNDTVIGFDEEQVQMLPVTMVVVVPRVVGLSQVTAPLEVTPSDNVHN